MADDEDQIRTLVGRWAAAVHSGDLDGVLTAHADDIVMFDVPPPDGRPCPDLGPRSVSQHARHPSPAEWSARHAADAGVECRSRSAA